MNTDTKLKLEELLGDDHCFIHVNPTIKGVIVPDHLRKEPTVSLKLSHYFAGVVVLREDKVEAELRFGSTPYQCEFPYESIWAVSSIANEVTIWEERALHPSFPKMLQESLNGQAAPAAAKPALAVKKVPTLTAVKTTPKEVDSPLPEIPETAEEQKKRPSFLKRVK